MSDQTVVTDVAVATYSELVSENGAALPDAEEPTLVVVDAAPRRRFATAPVAAHQDVHVLAPRFEGGEHTFLGNNATLNFEGFSGPAVLTPLTMPNGLALTYGSIVALGGDFYGLPNAPISDDPAPPTRFNQAFATLASAAAAVGEAPLILAVMQIEIDAVNQAIKQGKLPSTAYAALGDQLSGKWNRLTGGGSIVTDFFPLGRYLQLASTNWDHFGVHAVACYQAGHGVAMAAAAAAAAAPDKNSRNALLEVAYATNAFADHYLTDVFSSGHMRTPRKEMYDEVTPSAIGSLLSRFMHDEDCAFGLTVTNALGQTWHAYGDKRLRDPANAASLKIIEAAVQASVDEVWQAFQTKTVPASKVLDRIADLKKVAVPTDKTNPSPLFVAQNGTVERRTDPANRFDYSWTLNWWGWSTFTLLKSLPEFAALGDSPVPLELATDILQFWNNNGSVGLVQYGIKADGSYGTKWQNQNMGEGAGALTWIPVDANGDGKTDVIQCWNNNGRLGMIEYSPIAGADGYQVAWRNDDMGEGAGATAWIPVDMNGDGKTDIVQCWNNHGQLGMIVYSPIPNAAGYQVAWRNDDMGEGAGATAWIPLDMNGDGKTDIVQCWNNGGSLGMVVYSPVAGGGYKVVWQNDNMGQGAGATAWAPVDVDGDGKTEILQLWSNGGSLGMVVYAPSSGGGYSTAWSNPNMGQGAGAITWIPVDANGDGKTELLQLWNNNGQLGMVTYTPSSLNMGYEVAWQSRDVGQGAGAVGWLELTTGDAGSQTLAQLWNHGGSMALVVYHPNADGSWSTAGAVPNLGQGAGNVFLTAAGSQVPVVLPD